MADPYILLAIQLLDGFLMKKHGGIDEAMQRVRNNLSLILDFMADKKLEEGSRLKYWIDDVKEIARDFLLLLIHEKNAVMFPFLSLARALNETKKCIFKLGVEGAIKCPIASSSNPEGVDEDVVGLEEEVESLLRKSSGGLSTTCIVGMAGIGKTALARKLYNHASVVDRYEPRLWICVSCELSNKEVLMRLILQLRNNNDQSALLGELENLHNGGLQLMLRQHLQDKQFLIVLDDVGNIPYSESILKALPTQGKQSILLLTSRFRSIEYQLPTAQGSTHIMKPLDDDQSWHLFSKLLLFGNQQFPKQLERKGREMLRSCAGLPLSIKEVATQFVRKRQEGSQWEELLESIDLSRTFAILESCYHAWPPQLKLCFLFLSFFEKGTHIRIDKLVQVWKSAQVIPQEEEEEGRDFLEECQFNILSLIINPTGPRRLVSGNLEGYRTTLMKLNDESVIEIDMNYNLRIRCIRVNASFHAVSMAKAEEEMIFETLKKGGGGNPPSSEEPRHRAICCRRDEFNHFTDHDERLVSLFYRGGGYFDATELYWKRFQQLRTLDFEGFGLKMLPEAIGALTELRCLGLRDNYIQKLPESVGYLKNLETLDIALNFTIEVPNIVWKIGSLRHLYMSDVICWKPLKIDTLKNLETLTYISIDNWTYEASSLEMMTNLCILGIEEVDENLDLSKLFASLANLNLDCLILRGFRFRSLPSLHGLETLHHLLEIRLDGIITELPSADIFPPKIAYLSLINSSLDEDPMPELGKLNHLLYLKLKNAYTGEKMVIPKNSFRYLDSLCIEELWHLRNIQVEDSTFSLMKLEIKSCPYLENIPESVITHDTTEVEMLTTKRLAAKIRKSDFISKIEKLDIQP